MQWWFISYVLFSALWLFTLYFVSHELSISSTRKLLTYLPMWLLNMLYMMAPILCAGSVHGRCEALVQQINEMGLPAEKGSPKTKLQINDIVLRGYLVSISEGDTAKRVVIGFGYGGSELDTLVEGFQMTAKGLRKLGSGKVKAVGNKTPGGALGAVTMIANANPAGLIVGGVVKGYGEISGNSRVEGLAKSTAKEIAEALQARFKEEDWIK